MEFKKLRQGKENYADIFRGSQKRRFMDKSTIDQAQVLDILWKKTKHKFDISKSFLNKISRFVGKFQKIKKTKLFLKIIYLKKKLNFLCKFTILLEEKKESTFSLLGNLIHNNSYSGKRSRIVHRKICLGFLDFKKKHIKYNHVELLKMIGGVDYEKGIKIAGNRGYFFKGIGLLLNNSIIRYGLDFLVKKKFIALQTPFFMDKCLLSKCSQLEDFRDQLYSLNEDENKYLIATSEQPISIFHIDEKISRVNFPLKYVGFSTCFRKESGSHGRDTSGIFRVHQFEKIEQFIYCDSKDLKSWSSFGELLENVKNFYSSLDIQFKLVNIASQSLNNAAAMKIDLLGFFPKSQTYRELVSCSNCTLFQSRKINTQIENFSSETNHDYVCMLNSTLCATSRLICCILENYQQNFGVTIPRVLRNYTGISLAPFRDRK